MGATAGAEVRDAPAKMNGVEPELFFHGGARTEPRFEMAVGGLPVMPFDGGGIDGAGGGAEVVNVEGL